MHVTDTGIKIQDSERVPASGFCQITETRQQEGTWDSVSVNENALWYSG